MKNKFMYGGGVLATLFLSILFCFVSCDNGSTPKNNVPKIIDAYTLNGDIICLYDDSTFTIIPKDKVGTISGTYTSDTDGYKLTVGQSSDDKATSGDSLVLKVESNGNISVSQSDIDGYEEGDEGEQTVPPSQSGNPGSDDSSSDIRHSLRDDVSEELKIKENFSAVQNADGIQIKFTIPKDANAYEVYIDRIGLVTENFFGVGNMTEDDFFYPFLAPNKEYTIRVVFLKAEVEKDGWNYGHPDGDGIIGWFDVKATAGASSKGEVRLNDFGKIAVENNGDFKFTKKPAFENENLIQDWILGIGLSEGVSWLHDDRRSKWLTEIDIPNKEILNKKYNFYTYPRTYGDVTKVDFIVYRPKLFYKYSEKEYKYQWDGYTLDTNCRAEDFLWTAIDIKKSEDVGKIKGTWTAKRWEGDIDWDEIPYHEIDTVIMVIDGDTVKYTEYLNYTKRNGSAFTQEEVSEFTYYDDEEFYTLSDDGKTLTEKRNDKSQTLSEYFADYKGEVRYDDGSIRSYTAQYDLKLFNDGSALQVITSYKFDDDGADEYSYRYFQKQ